MCVMKNTNDFQKHTKHFNPIFHQLYEIFSYKAKAARRQNYPLFPTGLKGKLNLMDLKIFTANVIKDILILL